MHIIDKSYAYQMLTQDSDALAVALKQKNDFAVAVIAKRIFNMANYLNSNKQ